MEINIFMEVSLCTPLNTIVVRGTSYRYQVLKSDVVLRFKNRNKMVAPCFEKKATKTEIKQSFLGGNFVIQ